MGTSLKCRSDTCRCEHVFRSLCRYLLPLPRGTSEI